MTQKSRHWTVFAVLTCLVAISGFDAADASAGSKYRPTAPPSKPIPKPILRPLTPEMDLTNEPDPQDVFDKAVKEYAAGHLPQAEKLFQKTIELDPDNADAHFNLGAIKEWRNDWNAALSEYRAAHRAKPDDKEIADAVRAVEYKIRNRPAIEARMTKAKKEQEIAEHSRMAKEAFAAQNYADAVTHLQFLSENMPDDPKIQFALGQSLRALRNYDWAAYRLKMAIFLDPDNDLYRKTLVDLDKEMMDVQGTAFSETADRMLAHLNGTQYQDDGAKEYDY
jgi:tetratricopeptide (TPR) repeat protein